MVRRIIAVCPAGANETMVLATFRHGIDAGNISKDRSLAAID
jgi:coenzyme F420-reducing hydrogenase delta subunit